MQPRANVLARCRFQVRKMQRTPNQRISETTTAMNSYFRLESLLGNRDSRKVGVATVVSRRDDGSIALRYHSTDVVTARPDGTVTLRSGGWRTVTTKKRINSVLPAGFRLWQERFEWHVTTPSGDFLFEDGITL